MAKKATSNSTPNEAADPRGGDLPLGDPRWIPLVAEFKRLVARLASNHLAAEDLDRAVEGGAIRCMRRWADEHNLSPSEFSASRERKLVPSDYWIRQELVYTEAFGLTVRLRAPKGGAPAPPHSGWAVVGWAFFGWKPDVDRFWLRYEPPVEEGTSKPKQPLTPSNGPGAKPKRTDPEVAWGIAFVRNENAKFQKRYGLDKSMTRDDAVISLKKELRRDGQPVEISDSTLLRRIVDPALSG